MIIQSIKQQKYLRLREWDGKTVTPTVIDSYWVKAKDATNFEESRAREIREQLRVIFKDKDDFRLIN